ncbi:TNF receptor-associated factor 1 [Brienomyrus brachyistius]|uniref:TNF receptor-associated factor 1 n=1 Tax=Brienomyrus brachyistius TaxID=42636 RepID=UPI0020B2823B|nr:TNF receptor-associated factor 1 [Brienomyrus brachyistius]XP_048859062.1 TNF receptor-associated factor 1 [Brienomyrus brachyistius]
MAERPPGDLDGVLSAPGENEYPSGFPQNICDDVPQDKYLCSNCNNVLNKARQTKCGHRYCQACVTWLVRNNKNLVCKRCKEEDSSLENGNSILTPDNFFNDAAINKEISELKVHCANHGCTWRSVLKNYEDHQSQCDYALIPCNIGCGQMVERRKLASHLVKGCPNNMSACSSCSQAMSPAELQKHACQSQARGQKPAKTDEKVKNRQPTAARKKETCSFAEVGCTFKGNAEKVKEHEASSHVAHLQFLLQVMSNLQACVLASTRTGQESQDPCGQIAALGEAIVNLQMWGTADVEADGGNGGCIEASLAQSLQDGQAAGLLVQRLEKLQERVHISENIITVLNREVEKTQLGIAMLDQQNQANRETIQDLENQITEHQRSMVIKDILLNDMHQRITAQEEVSYDGTFLWKVCNISQRMRDASTGRKSNHFSPAFYTSRYGFRVCMRLYLNGDGVGKGTHISLFFVVMKGEYDALLSWPFKHKVTFFLLDQNHKEHVIDAFRPDLSSSSFQRPITEMNLASGCPSFCPLGKLWSPRHGYCKDDTLFIKCVVDTTS